MEKALRLSLKVNAAVCALIALNPTTAWAQESEPGKGPDGGLGEILVTARRVTENMQEVPISVGALGNDTLKARGIVSLTDIKSAVANVYISKTGVAGGNYITIRGVTGTSIPNVNADSNIGLYIDGIFIARQNSAGGDIADLDRVEVLRGPQGTLSGRNSAAGAINFVTASPTGEFGGILEGQVGNFGRYRGRITINTPTFSGFSARITYVHDQNHGVRPNLAAGKTYNYGPYWGSFTAAPRVDALNSDTVLAKLRYRNDSGLTVEYKFDFLDQWEVFPGANTVGFPTTSLGVASANLYLSQPVGAIPLSRTRPDYSNQDMIAPSHIRSSGHTLTASLEANDSLTIKSITGYRKLDTLQEGDVDGLALNTPLCLSCSLVKIEQSQVSEELQLLGNISKLKYIFGGYYFREKGFGDNSFSFFKSLVPGSDGIIPVGIPDYAVAGSRDDVRNTSYAAYAHLEYPILANLNLAVGARYTHDKRVSLDLRPNLPAPALGQASFNRFNYDVALTYSVTPDVHLYARYATGYQSGGFIKGVAFRPEDHKSFEAGIKSEFLDRKVRLNAAYFHTSVKDLQRTEVNASGLIIRNYTNAKIDGFELEVSVAPVRGLTLNGNLGYAKLTLPAIFADVPLQPRTTFNFSGQYDAPAFNNGMYLSFRVDGDYRSKNYGSGMLTAAQRTANPAFNLPAAIWAADGSQQAYLDHLIRDILAGGYWLANARISLNDIPVGTMKMRITGYVRNIGDTQGRNYVVNNGFFQTSYERPRTYGLEVGLQF